MKKLLLFVSLFLISLLLVSYFFLGLGEFLNASFKLENLTSEQKKDSKANFYTIDTTRQYSGILGFWNTNNSNPILIWGKYGPKLFLTNNETIYSHFTFCSDDVLNIAKTKDARTYIGRTVTQDKSSWAGKIKKGGYVAISHLDTTYPIKLAREVKTTDVWAFMPLNIFEECEKINGKN